MPVSGPAQVPAERPVPTEDLAQLLADGLAQLLAGDGPPPLDPSAPFTKVKLRCRCGCLWEVHRHREAGSILASKKPLPGVTMTILQPGLDGSRSYRCRCGYEAELFTRLLSTESRRAYEEGRSTIVAGVDVVEVADDVGESRSWPLQQ